MFGRFNADMSSDDLFVVLFQHAMEKTLELAQGDSTVPFEKEARRPEQKPYESDGALQDIPFPKRGEAGVCVCE